MPTNIISEMEHPLNPICELWLRKIKAAEDFKREKFGQFADEGARFYDGAHDFMWDKKYREGQGGFLDRNSVGSGGLPAFRMTVNRVFEAVALFGPALFHQYPNVMVSPVNPPTVPPEVLGINVEDPYQAEQFQQVMMREQLQRASRGSYAELKQYYLNWLQVEADKKTHARRSITEAIVKGLGILWTEMFQPSGSQIKYPRSVHVSCDDIVKDPDAKYAEDVQWIARRCVHPLNKVEREYGLPRGALKGHLQSQESQATTRGRYEVKSQKKHAESFDLLEYWKIYSKNGFGDKLKATDKMATKSKYSFEGFGDFTMLVVSKNIPFPLNMPSWALAQEDTESLFMRAQWPIPFWTDEGCGNGWPMSELHFYEKMNCVWPLSLVKPAIGELRFVNWAMSFLADKVAASSTTYVAVAKKAGMEIQDQLSKGLAPYSVVEISEMLGKSINDVVTFLESPSFSLDIWKMVSEVLEMIDKRTGLTELVYGLSSRQLRSAREADIRDNATNIRPDDMATRTEEWMSQSAMKEMEAACWLLEEKDMQPVLGEVGATVLARQIREQDFETVVRDYAYRVEAGSARKPNKQNRVRNLTEFGQVALPTIQQFAAQGHVDPWNAYMREMGKALDFDAEPFLLRLPEPEGEGGGPSEEEIQAKRAALEMKLKEDEHDLELSHADEKHEQELKHERETHRLKLALAGRE